MSYLLKLMLTEEYRMHARYSSRRMFLAFPAFVGLFSFAIGATSARLLEVTPLGQAVLMLHVSAFLYGLGVGGFGFLGAQYLERRHGDRNYIVAMPALLSFLLGMSLSFFVSTLYMRSRIAFAGAVAVICGAFAAHGLFRLVPIETLLPGLAMHYALPPFAPPGGAALIAGLAGLGLIAACVAGALVLVPDQYEPRSKPEGEELPGVDARLGIARGYRILLAKEFVDLKRSGTVAKMFFSFVTPLIFLSFTAWFVRTGLRAPVGFNSVFYGGMVGFFGVLLYNWLNSVDSMDYYATLPVGVPTVIRTKLLAFLVLTTGISTAFVVGVSALNGDVRLLWLALPVMFVTSVYMVVMTAYLTGLRTNSFLFDPAILAQFSVLAVLPDLGLTILSFTVDRDPAFTVAGISLVLAALAIATLFLYRGLDRKWAGSSFTE